MPSSTDPLLDRLPPWARDLTVALLPALLGWATSDVIPLLHDHTGSATITSALLATLLYTLTTQLTIRYGRGAPPARHAASHDTLIGEHGPEKIIPIPGVTWQQPHPRTPHDPRPTGDDV